jgi:murein DD-endopeptidase MepM/ murein hydrolase activator NlpD
MMRINTKLFVLVVFATVFVFFLAKPVFADINQQILDLRAQVDALTKQANLYKNNITAKQKEADTLARQISILNNQISELTTSISITENQISLSKIEIANLENKIFDAQEKINKQKAAIGILIGAMDERDRLSLVAVLIKNPSLATFSDQIQQDKAMNEQMSDMLVVIKKEKEDMQADKTSLELKKSELELLNGQQEAQKQNVVGSKQDKDQLLKVTKGKEQEYQKLLSQVEVKQKQFFQDLKNLEAQAVSTGAYILHVTAPKVPPKGTWNIRWPEDSYRITQGYGMTAYAKSGAYGGAPHNGVDMAHGSGTAIHPIDDGTILASGFSDGWGNWVSVLHTNGMVSLYGHFRAPSGIANGTAVTKTSIIGYEGTTGNSTGSHLHLSIYKDFFTYLNAKHKNQIYFNYFEGTVNPFDYLP